MNLGHDTRHALGTAVALVNSRPTSGNPDGLPDLAALQRFVAEQRMSEVETTGPADLEAVRALRNRFRRVWSAGSVQERVDRVNAIMSGARTTPRLTDHDGYDWHIHYFAPGAGIAEHLATDCGMALALLLAAGEGDRLRVCEAPGCERVLVDLSRNRSRRYCDSRTCGNRLHVAAYRARKAAAVR